jgi:hypothetical protein
MKLAAKGVLLLCLGCAAGCKDAFVKTLDKDKVILMAPGNNVVSDSAQQNFFWQPVDTSIDYEFQIVTPDFDSVVSLVVDTTIATNLLPYTLVPGQYQWRVRAFNSVSTTVFSQPWTITIN